MSIFWEWYQLGLINDAKHKANSAQTVAERASRDVQHRIDALVLANAAMWSILRDKLGATDADLIAKMRELDAADGRFDGRLGAKSTTCKACNRAVVPRNGRCIYCGVKVSEAMPFDEI